MKIDNKTRKEIMKFYRYSSIRDENGPKLLLEIFELIKETPCGYWIKDRPSVFVFDERKRWVSKTAKKRYAYPTKMEAMISFKMRRLRQIAILKSRLLDAEWELDLIKEIIKKENENSST